MYAARADAESDTIVRAPAVAPCTRVFRGTRSDVNQLELPLSLEE